MAGDGGGVSLGLAILAGWDYSYVGPMPPLVTTFVAWLVIEQGEWLGGAYKVIVLTHSSRRLHNLTLIIGNYFDSPEIDSEREAELCKVRRVCCFQNTRQPSSPGIHLHTGRREAGTCCR